MNDSLSVEGLIARYYRWWTVQGGRCSVITPWWFVKLGPLTVSWYRWTDGGWRAGWTWMCGEEHRIF